MAKKKTRPVDEPRAERERLPYTLPATRVSEQTYKRLMERMERERRERISEVVRLSLDDWATAAV